MAASLAAVRVLESEGGLRLADRAAFVAGHSLGEYSALAAVGSLELADAARLLRRRGQAMQERSEEHTSELQSLMRISYAVFCLKKQQTRTTLTPSHCRYRSRIYEERQ